MIETELDKPCIGTKKDSNKCWICKQLFKKSEVKEKDHDM